MQEEVLIPDGLFRCRIGERQVSIDLIEATMEINTIVERNKDKNNFEYLADFKSWVESKNPGLNMSLGQSDGLWKTIHIERKRADTTFFTTLNSFDSTESTSED